MKVCKIIFIITLFIIMQYTIVFAADADYRFMHNDQNLLIIGEIKDINNERIVISVKHKIVSSKDMNMHNPKTLKETPKEVSVINDFRYMGYGKTLVGENEDANMLHVNDYILISLDKHNNNLYKCQWGAYKVSSPDYRNLRILTPDDISDYTKGTIAAVEYFVNSNGKYNEFSFNKDNKVYVRKSENEMVPIYTKESAAGDAQQALSSTAQAADENNGKKIFIIGGVILSVILGVTFMIKYKITLKKE